MRVTRYGVGAYLYHTKGEPPGKVLLRIQRERDSMWLLRPRWLYHVRLA